MAEHLECSGVSGELVVGVVKVWLITFVKRLHGGNLVLYFVFDHWIDLVEEAGFVGDTLAQHEAYSALHVVALLDTPGPHETELSPRDTVVTRRVSVLVCSARS